MTTAIVEKETKLRLMNSIVSFWKKHGFEEWSYEEDLTCFVKCAGDETGVYNAVIMEYLKEIKSGVAAAKKVKYMRKFTPDIFVETLKANNEPLIKFLIEEGFMDSKCQITLLCEDHNFDVHLQFSPILNWISGSGWWKFDAEDTKSYYVKTDVYKALSAAVICEE